jgi:hypothetical protein
MPSQTMLPASDLVAIEELARWMHQKYRALNGADKRPWDEVSDIQRNGYRMLAAELLTDPPAVLRAAAVKKLYR